MKDELSIDADITLKAPTRMEQLAAVRPRLLSFARLRDSALAEDVVQEAQMAAIDRMFQQSERWEEAARPSAWGEPEVLFESEYFWQVFDACMIALPDNIARIFLMRELMGLSTEPICEEVGIKEKTAGSSCIAPACAFAPASRRVGWRSQTHDDVP